MPSDYFDRRQHKLTYVNSVREYRAGAPRGPERGRGPKTPGITIGAIAWEGASPLEEWTSSGTADTPELRKSVPIRFGGDTMLWAVWLYYAEGRTQSEVSQMLGVSRASVANYLARARRDGLVTVNIVPDVLSRVTRSVELAERYGLAGAGVTPALEGGPAGGDETPRALRRRLGIAAAQVLLPRLGTASVLGVAWGRTMLEVARALPERRLPATRVVQVSGSSLGDTESSPEACTALIAGRLGARCYNFHAPAVVSSRALRDALLRESTLIRHFERMRACDSVIFGIGELSGGTIWSDTDSLPPAVAGEYVARGAAGIVIGRFIDGAGREVEGPLSGRQIGMELGDLAAVPERICVAGGPEKIGAIRAALMGGYVTHLVTDALSAATLLEVSQ